MGIPRYIDETSAVTQVPSRGSASGHWQVGIGTVTLTSVALIRSSTDPLLRLGHHLAVVTLCQALPMARILLLRGHGPLGRMASLALYQSISGTSEYPMHINSHETAPSPLPSPSYYAPGMIIHVIMWRPCPYLTRL
jgi:hypothetical protein